MIRPNSSKPLRNKVTRLVVLETALVLAIFCTASFLFLRGDLQKLALRNLDAAIEFESARVRGRFTAFAEDAVRLANRPETLAALALLSAVGEAPVPADITLKARREVEQVLDAFLAFRPGTARVRLVSVAGSGSILTHVARSAPREDAAHWEPGHAREFPGVAESPLAPGEWRFLEPSAGAATIEVAVAMPGPGQDTAGFLVVETSFQTLVGSRPFDPAGAGTQTIVTVRAGDLPPGLHAPARNGMPLAMIEAGSPERRGSGSRLTSGMAFETVALDVGGGLNVWLAVTQPAGDLMAEVDNHLSHLVLLSLAVLAATVILASFMAGRLAAPLSELAFQVGRPRSETEPMSLPIRGYREVEILASAFEQMVNTLIMEGRETEAVFNAAAEGILMTDVNGTILRANPAAEKIFAADPGDLTGRNIEELLPKDQRPLHTDYLRQIREDRAGIAVANGRSICGLRMNGERFPLEASVNSVSVNERRTLIAIVRDVSARRARDRRIASQNKELIWLATHDLLSGLLNRRGVDDALRRLAETGGDVTVVQIDLDRFKLVNDTLGHEAGDMVIKVVAERLRETCTPDDHIGRLGGDEFVILRAGADPVATEAFTRRIMLHLSQPVDYQGTTCRFGVSIGAADGPARLLLSGDLLKRADHALYRAKREGRGQHRYFTPEMERRVEDRAQLAADLEVAMDSDEMFVEYMPKVDAAEGRLIGLEALVRWNHPRKGLLMPEDFLPLAEELKLTGQIDKQVLSRALADRKEWRAAGRDVPPISVNVSARRLADPSLVGNVRDLNIPRGAISFELLESIFLDDADPVRWSTDALRELGIGIEIDDFGSGHASILGITQIRPDWIKIDSALVRNIVESDSSRTLIRAITEMATPFGVSTLAEGVETEAQARILGEIGCAGLQGFHVGRPQCAAHTMTLLPCLLPRAATA